MGPDPRLRERSRGGVRRPRSRAAHTNAPWYPCWAREKQVN